MEARSDHQKQRTYKSLYMTAVALSIGAIIMTFSWLLRYRGGFGGSTPELRFNYHPLLMVLTMVALFGMSILIYRTFFPYKKRTLKIAHTVCNATTFIGGVAGIVLVMQSHNDAKPPIPHLYSFHSWLGLLTVICFGLQFMVGFVTYLYPSLSKRYRDTVISPHRSIGLALFLLAVMTSLTGLTEKTIFSLNGTYSSLPAEAILVNMIAVFIALYGLLVAYLVTTADFKREPLPEEEVALAPSSH